MTPEEKQQLAALIDLALRKGAYGLQEAAVAVQLVAKLQQPAPEPEKPQPTNGEEKQKQVKLATR